MDGNAYIYRAFYAIEDLSTSTGIPTNAVFGFTRLLLSLLHDDQPDYIAIAFDSAGPTFRHKEFAEYKADRPKMPDTLSQQLPTIREVVDALNVSVIEVPGYEADDIIGTLAKKAEAQDMEVVIVTGDKDALQLVTPNIKVNPYSFRGVFEKGFVYDEEKVRSRHGVEPDKITDIMGLMGDKIDNIPGVPGIGKVTAPKLINEFGSLEELLENIDEVKSNSQRKALEEFKDQALLSKRLATIDVDVPLQVNIPDLKVKDYEDEKLLELFLKLEFRQFIKDMDLGRDKVVETKYHTILDESDLDKLVESLKQVQEFAIDTETTDIDPISAELVGISISYKPHEAYYIPVGHRYMSCPEQIPLETVIKKLMPVLADPKIGKIGQNIKYDIQILRKYGAEIENISYDTMLGSYILNPSARRHSLDNMSLEYFGYEMIPIETLIGKGKNQTTMDSVDLEAASKYACEDADLTLRIKEQQEPGLQKNDLESVFREIELPLIPVLADMELTGIKLDTGYLKEVSTKMDTRLKALTDNIFELAGESFNINSPKQLSYILFEKLGLPPGKRTKTGYSTNEAELERLSSAGYELPEAVLEYRSLSKLKSTYVDALPASINPETARVHTFFNQAVTETGRLSSSNPNLQNIPVRTEEGREIRRAFIPGGECNLLLAADYSQIELRMLAHLSGDATLVDAFRKDEDIHSRTGSLIFGLPIDQITPEMRRQAKTINFGVIYGMGAFRLARELDIPLKDAKTFIESYFATYSGVKEYFDGIIEFARENGYVTTISGRRRRISEIKSRNRNTREFAERTAINTPVQGSAADMIKMAMIKIADFFKSKKLKSKLLLQVHDELVFEVAEEELDMVNENVIKLMEEAMKLEVPIKVDVGIGKNWLEAK
ncbi:DNA polymerase I [Candidatus Poribacteria bacterium]|nr:DNA polymerase I [Candidatus Poribacteria bacterium]